MPATPVEFVLAADEIDIALDQRNATQGLPNTRRPRAPVAQHTRDNDTVDAMDPVLSPVIIVDLPTPENQRQWGEIVAEAAAYYDDTLQGIPTDEEQLLGAVGGVPAEFAYIGGAGNVDPPEYFEFMVYTSGSRDDGRQRNAEAERTGIGQSNPDSTVNIPHDAGSLLDTAERTSMRMSIPSIGENVSFSRSSGYISAINSGHVAHDARRASSSTLSDLLGLPSAEEPSTSSRNRSPPPSLSQRGHQQRNVPSRSQNERPAHPEFANVVTRGVSFQRWPEQHEVLTDYLSRVGLFYTGFENHCACFYCGSAFENWWHQDDPILEHIQLHPNCDYIRRLCEPDFISALQNQDQLRASFYSQGITQPRHEDMPSDEEQLLGAVGGVSAGRENTRFRGNGPSPTLSSRHGSRQNEMSVYPEYGNIVSRGTSFQTWPRQYQMSTDYFSRVGLFYAGFENHCICFHCGTTFQNWWRGDDPIHEHIRLFPHCENIRKLCRPDYISNLQRQYQQRPTTARHEGTVVRPEGFMNLELSTHPTVVFFAVFEGFDVEMVLRIADEIRMAGQKLTSSAILARLRQDNPQARGNPLHTAQSYASSQHDVTEGHTNQSTVTQVPTTSTAHQQELEVENQRLTKRLMCVCCEIRVIKYLFCPCGHPACHVCNAKFQSCILCGSQITVRHELNIDL